MPLISINDRIAVDPAQVTAVIPNRSRASAQSIILSTDGIIHPTDKSVETVVKQLRDAGANLVEIYHKQFVAPQHVTAVTRDNNERTHVLWSAANTSARNAAWRMSESS